jgi:hypothetical protein
LGFHLFEVDLPGVLDRFPHGSRGNLVKEDPGEAVAVPQDFHEVEGDGFSFPVGIGGEEDRLCAFRFFPEFGDNAAVADHPFGGKAVMDVHAQFVFGQVPDMPPGGEDQKSPAKIGGDGSGLRWRLHNDHVFRHSCRDHYAIGPRIPQPVGIAQKILGFLL